MFQRRRWLRLISGCVAALSLPALSQSERRIRRIGFLSLGSAEAQAVYLPAFRAGMTALRWIEGRDYVIDARHAESVVQAMAGKADELLALQPDLLLTTGEGTIRVLARKTRTIPIVFARAQDPVASGFAASLSRPGGNATGLTTLGRDLSGKRLQLLKEAFPRIGHVAVLLEPEGGGTAGMMKEIETATTLLGVRITFLELRQPADIEPAFKRGIALGASAYMLVQGGVVNTARRAIAERTKRLRTPAMFPDEQHVEAGGLMSYSASSEDNFRRAAGYVDKILKGAKPGDLPIEQPTRFELVVNMKTAKAMGIAFSQSFLIRVDRVIE